jgi:hypothetical protein
MRLWVAAFLTGALLGTPANATEKLTTPDAPAQAKPDAAKPDVAKPDTAKPVLHVAANKPVDLGDMRCAFAVRHRDVLDSQIIAWAGGFLEGYAKSSPEHVAGRSLSELTDPALLRTHIRGYCLKHREKSIEAALTAMILQPPRASAAPAVAAPHPAQPTPHTEAPK